MTQKKLQRWTAGRQQLDVKWQTLLLLVYALLLVATSALLMHPNPPATGRRSGAYHHSLVTSKRGAEKIHRSFTVACDAITTTLSTESRRTALNRFAFLSGLVSSGITPHHAGASEGEQLVKNFDTEANAAAAPPPPYHVRLTVQVDPTTTGIIEIEVIPSWAPLAAERFRRLIEVGFLDGSRFSRVLPGYVAQFGISADPALNKEWLLCEKNCRALMDEPRTERNRRGTLSFASSGKNSRQTQVFINLANNDGPPNFLDAQGFVPFAKVVQGFDEVVMKLNSEYGVMESVSGGLAGSVNQGKAAYYGKEYLEAVFPKLSYINTAEII